MLSEESCEVWEALKFHDCLQIFVVKLLVQCMVSRIFDIFHSLLLFNCKFLVSLLSLLGFSFKEDLSVVIDRESRGRDDFFPRAGCKDEGFYEFSELSLMFGLLILSKV